MTMPTTLRYLLAGFSVLLLAVTMAHGQTTVDDMNFSKRKVFDEVSAIVAEHFYDRQFDTAAWKVQTNPFRKNAISATSLDEYAGHINSLLATLNTSHTRYFSRHDPRRYQLLGVFHPLFDANRKDLFVYCGIGMDTKSVDGKTYVTSAYDGLPAARAGIRFGDQIVSVDDKPFHPVRSFANQAGQSVEVKIIRDGTERDVDVEVAELDGRTMFETALESSTRVIEHADKKVGYLHVWSFAGTKYQDQIRSTILWGQLAQCDALILDLRDGWGGADINYLNLFRPPIAEVRSASRRGTGQNYTGVWGKPVALITNGGSTSGKELYSFGFQKLKLGKIIGERTAGAVVGGRIFLLSNGDVLYLAVNDVSVDGTRLEGNGVRPDIEVKRELFKPAGDPQLEAALKHLAG